MYNCESLVITKIWRCESSQLTLESCNTGFESEYSGCFENSIFKQWTGWGVNHFRKLGIIELAAIDLVQYKVSNEQILQAIFLRDSAMQIRIQIKNICWKYHRWCLFIQTEYNWSKKYDHYSLKIHRSLSIVDQINWNRWICNSVRSRTPVWKARKRRGSLREYLLFLSFFTQKLHHAIIIIFFLEIYKFANV